MRLLIVPFAGLAPSTPRDLALSVLQELSLKTRLSVANAPLERTVALDPKPAYHARQELGVHPTLPRAPVVLQALGATGPDWPASLHALCARRILGVQLLVLPAIRVCLAPAQRMRTALISLVMTRKRTALMLSLDFLNL